MATAASPQPQPPVAWNADNLQPLRSIGDPLADAAITELFADGGVQAMNALMSGFVANEHPVPDNLPAPVRTYLQQTFELPSWADRELIKAGEDVFWRFGPRMILILTCYSLPFCYLGRNGVVVLAMTNRLSSNPRRRVLETAARRFRRRYNRLQPQLQRTGPGHSLTRCQPCRRCQKDFNFPKR